MDLIQFSNKKIITKLNKLGNRLCELKTLISWQRFNPLIEQIRNNKTSKGGRPNKDNIVMLKILILQRWFSLSDEQTEFMILDRVSFQDFLGISYTEVPDFTTVWRFREELRKQGIGNKIWDELQNQIVGFGFSVKQGHIQDATFIEAQPGKKRREQERKAKKEGKEIEYTKKQGSHIDKDATFTVRRNQVYFGYKDHVKTDVDHNFVRSFETTPAHIHDNNIELEDPGDIAMYRDRGYSGKQLKYPQVNDMTMIRKDQNKEWVKNMNKGISKIRVLGERQFSVVKYVFKGGYTYAKSLSRVKIGQMFTYFAYNLYNLFTYRNEKIHDLAGAR